MPGSCRYATNWIFLCSRLPHDRGTVRSTLEIKNGLDLKIKPVNYLVNNLKIFRVRVKVILKPDIRRDIDRSNPVVILIWTWQKPELIKTVHYKSLERNV